MKNARRHQHQGSSLLEVLVSLTILAVGMLGMSGLQSTSLRSNQNAYLRTQASIFSLDIVERMKANKVAVNAGSYNDTSGEINANCLTTTGCSSSSLASHDIAEWQAAVGAGLPSGQSKVCLDSTPDDGTFASSACDGAGNLYAIKIWWDNNRDGSADRNLVMSFQP